MVSGWFPFAQDETASALGEVMKVVKNWRQVMDLTTLSSTELGLIISAVSAVVGLIIVAIVAWHFLRKRRTENLRTQFGGAEYDPTVKEDGSREACGSWTEGAQRTSGEFRPSDHSLQVIVRAS